MHQQSPAGVQVIGAPQRVQAVAGVGSGMALYIRIFPSWPGSTAL